MAVATQQSVRCLVLVKMYGNSPRKLFVRNISNSDVRMNEFHFLFLELFLFLGVVYLLKRLLLCCCVMGLVKFLLRLVSMQ